MSASRAFDNTAKSYFYETSGILTEEDRERIAALTALVHFLPEAPNLSMSPEALRVITLRLGAITGPSGLGRGFEHAFYDFSKLVARTNALDGSKSAVLQGNAYDKLLDGFMAFHSQQKALRPSAECQTLFANMCRTRQIYGDMQDSGFPVSYEPTALR